jgi:hypothetical protein
MDKDSRDDIMTLGIFTVLSNTTTASCRSCQDATTGASLSPHEPPPKKI